jgi:F-type H+-transporting ATPase subunit b
MSAIDSVILAAGEEPSPFHLNLPELIVGVIAFALLLFVLWKFVFPQFEKTFEERAAAIEGGISKAEQAQAEANALLEQYKAQLAEARGEAAAIRERAHTEGARILEELRAEGLAQKERIVTSGQEALATERERLVHELRGQVGELAIDLAGRIVGESLADDARRSGAVDRFLGELETGAAGGRR